MAPMRAMQPALLAQEGVQSGRHVMPCRVRQPGAPRSTGAAHCAAPWLGSRDIQHRPRTCSLSAFKATASIAEQAQEGVGPGPGRQQMPDLWAAAWRWLTCPLAFLGLAATSLCLLLLPRPLAAQSSPMPQGRPPLHAAVCACEPSSPGQHQPRRWRQQPCMQQEGEQQQQHIEEADPCTDAALRTAGKASTSYAQPAPAVAAAAATPPAPMPPLASVSVSPALSSYKEQRAQDFIASKLASLAQAIMNDNVAVKILALFASAVPIIYLGGLAYSLITGAPIQLGLFKIYSVVIRAPGAKVTEETSLPAAALMNFFFLCGLFTFAVLIGLLSEEIKASLKAVRVGNYPVVCEHHTLILNWNQQARLLLRKMANDGHGCSETLGRTVVILAEESREQLEPEVRHIVNGSKLNVVMRQGTPHFVRDLEAVSAASARTVVLLHRDSDPEAEIHRVATILGLQTARSHPSIAFPAQRIVMQCPCLRSALPGIGSEAPMGILKDSIRGRDIRIVEVNGNRNIARLVAQSAVQPGVATIYSFIAQSIPGCPDLYLRECGEAFAGRTFAEARRSFDRAVVCGYIAHGTKATFLNPPDKARLEYADRLIALAQSREEFVPRLAGQRDVHQPNMQELEAMLETAAPITHTPKSIVVIGWSPDSLADLVTAVQDFGYAGSEITVVSEQRPQDLPSTGTVAVHWVEGGVLDRASYERAGVASAHSVVLGSVHAQDPKAADARMLTSLLLVQDIVAESPHTPHIVAAMQNPETVLTAQHILHELGRGRLTAELLQPDEMVSGMLLQVANEPSLAPALAELTSDSIGSEIYLRRPAPYGLDSSRPYSFREVSELARLRGETALGWANVKGGEAETVLAPCMSQELRFFPESRIIVLAED